MVEVVGHGYHSGRRQGPAEAPSHDLPVELIVEVLCDASRCKNIGVFGEDLLKLKPFLLHSRPVVLGTIQQVGILGLSDDLIRHIEEKLNVRHQVKVRLPERILALQILVYQAQ